ncbi:AP-5 complex subunit sigma-1 isoform 2-T2 [Anomaloglossus baeobatrachus]|uniref:AP-5 complex subunit sigma-1 isoform X2 n=1 Tax=Anomaloglossus baeobatrachus TaxID=238106 RepID=UPI003F50CA94
MTSQEQPLCRSGHVTSPVLLWLRAVPDCAMVYGFLMHSVGSAPGGPPCRVLYQRLFSCEVLDEQRRMDEDFLEQENVRRKEQMAAVARLVASRCLLRRQVSARPVAESEEMVVLQEEDVGVLGLPAGAPFPQEMVVLFFGVHLFGFSLICDPQENLTLAEMTLRMMVKYLLETLRLATHSSHAVLRADKMELILDTFIPQGALLFLSHAAVQALEKELSGCMTA